MHRPRRSTATTSSSSSPVPRPNDCGSNLSGKKRSFGVIPNEFVASARVQAQRLMPMWLSKARWVVLRGSKTPILAVYRQVSTGVVLDDNPLRVMILGDDTIVQVAGEKGMVVTSSRVRRNDTWVLGFKSSAQRKRMYELVKLWIELGAFLQSLTGFASIAKSHNSVVYKCQEREEESANVGSNSLGGAEDEALRTQLLGSSSSAGPLPFRHTARGGSHRARHFALKRVSKTRCLNEIQITERALAIEGLQPYLARYLYMYENSKDNSVTIVMKFYSGGSLADRIRDAGALHEKVAKSVTSSLCCALYSLHQHGILHLDIKAGNILFDSDSPRTFTNLKLVDFGSSTLRRTQRRRMTYLDNNGGEGDSDPVEDEKERQRKAMGTYGCMAPERFEGNYGPEADVYGAGIVLYHMVVGEIPFTGSDPYQVMVKNMQGNVSFASTKWQRVSKQLRHLAKRMLDKDPKTRITIPEILKLRWLFQNLSTHELHAQPTSGTGSSSGSMLNQPNASANTGVRSRGVSSSGSYSNYSLDYFSRSIPRSAKYA